MSHPLCYGESKNMKLNLNPSTNSEPERVLIYFTQSPILRQIGHRRLAKLLKPFDEDLKAARLVSPEPDPQNDDYFADLANALSTATRLPARLQQTLLTIELPASPENDQPLWSEDCALDRALDLWFAAPDEFPALHSLRGGGSEGGSAFPETSTPSAFSLPPSAFPERPPSLPPEERPRGEEATPLAYLPYSEELRGP